MADVDLEAYALNVPHDLAVDAAVDVVLLQVQKLCTTQIMMYTTQYLLTI